MSVYLTLVFAAKNKEIVERPKWRGRMSHVLPPGIMHPPHGQTDGVHNFAHSALRSHCRANPTDARRLPAPGECPRVVPRCQGAGAQRTPCVWISYPGRSCTPPVTATRAQEGPSFYRWTHTHLRRKSSTKMVKTWTSRFLHYSSNWTQKRAKNALLPNQ